MRRTAQLLSAIPIPLLRGLACAAATATLFIGGTAKAAEWGGQSSTGKNSVPASAAPQTKAPVITCPNVLSQSVDSSFVQDDTGIACRDNITLVATENHFLRIYDLAAEGITDDYVVDAITWGADQAVAGAGFGGVQPGALNLYTLSGPLQFSNMTLLSNHPISIPDGQDYVMTTDISDTVVPAGSIVVVELFIPDATADGHIFIPGANSAGQTAPGYIAAAGCSLPEPVTYASVGFPNTHLILDLCGCERTRFTTPLIDNTDIRIGTNNTLLTGASCGTFPNTWLYQTAFDSTAGGLTGETIEGAEINTGQIDNLSGSASVTINIYGLGSLPAPGAPLPAATLTGAALRATNTVSLENHPPGRTTVHAIPLPPFVVADPFLIFEISIDVDQTNAFGLRRNTTSPIAPSWSGCAGSSSFLFSSGENAVSLLSGCAVMLNSSPSITGTASTSDPWNEGQLVSFSVNFADADSADTHNLEADMGNGDVLFFPNVTPPHSFQYAYPDDDPTGTAQDNYTISFRVIDSKGYDGTGGPFSTRTVNNVNPVADAGGPYSVPPGGTVGLTGSETDAGVGDTHTFEWDLDGDNNFGETGAAATRGDEDVQNPTFDATGLPTGPFTVTLLVTDDDTGSGTDTATINVIPLSTISDFVWEDLNGDGFQDAGEPGVDGVLVELLSSPGNAFVTSTTTAGGGLYALTNVAPGTYAVRFTAPSGFEFTTHQTIDTDLNSDVLAEFTTGPQLTAPFTIGPGDNPDDIDAGLIRRVPVEGVVWLDVDCDGLRGTGEPLLENVLVLLRDVTSPDPPTTTTTDSSGFYSFPPQVPSTEHLQVQVTLPSVAPGISEFTEADVGSDDGIDSDITFFTGTVFPNSGRADNLILVSGQTVETVDAGMKDPTSPTPTLVCDPFDGGCSPLDTVVHRIELDEAARLRVEPVVDIELVELSLVSVEPVNVTPGPGVFDTEWDIEVQASMEGVPATLTLLADMFEDLATNGSNESNSCTFTFDETNPDVTCTQTAPGLDLVAQSALSATSPLVFTALFNEEVTGVDASDFTVNGPGPSTLSVIPDPGPASSYVLELAVTAIGVYEIGWAAPSADWIEDCAGNDFGGSATTAQTEFIAVGLQAGNRVRASDFASGDRFGWSVSVDAETALIGAPSDDDMGSASGSVYVFERDSASSMVETQKIVAPDGLRGDQFGRSVDIRGDRAVMGAPFKDDVASNAGAVYVMDRDVVSRIWGAPLKLDLPLTTVRNAQAGHVVGVFGDTVVAGAPGGGAFGQGQVLVWERDPCTDTWGPATILTAFDAAGFDRLGSSVSIDGARIVAGSPGDDDNGSNTGSMYSFVRSSGVWVPEPGAAKILPAGVATGDQFGFSVALRGDIAIGGARGDDDGANNAGAAYAMTRGLLGWTDVPGGKMTALDPKANADLGDSVDFDGSTVVVGGGDDTTNGTGAGVFYSFDASTWMQIDKHLTAETGRYDELGRSVGVSGPTVVGGAPQTAADPGTINTRVGGAFFHQLP